MGLALKIPWLGDMPKKSVLAKEGSKKKIWRGPSHKLAEDGVQEVDFSFVKQNLLED